LFYALAWPVEPDRRHLIVAFTDGWDSWSTLKAESLPALSSRSDAVLQVVFWSTPDRFQDRSPWASTGIEDATAGLRPRMSRSELQEWVEGYRAVIAAAERTGGTYRPVSAGTDSFKTILDDFRTSYVLRYTPRGVNPKGWHDLKVRAVGRGSLDIRARKGYEGG
jgi:hypothetical protein